jgi:hypothetical protein
MRTRIVVPIIVVVVGVTAGCGKDSGGSTGPSRTVTAVSLSPTTDMIRIKGSETYTATARYSDGSSETVQGTWSSAAANIASVEGNGRVTGVSSGSTTITGTYQGMSGTQALRVVPDYHGRWSGDWQVRSCSATGDWAGACAEFPPGDLFGFTLNATQTRDTITGTTDFGDDLPGPITGTIATNGHLAVTGTYTVNVEGISLEVTVSDWDTNTTDNQTMTGRLRLTFRAAGLQGTLQNDGEIRVVTKVSSTPSAFPASQGTPGFLSAIAASRR